MDNRATRESLPVDQLALRLHCVVINGIVDIGVSKEHAARTLRGLAKFLEPVPRRNRHTARTPSTDSHAVTPSQDEETSSLGHSNLWDLRFLNDGGAVLRLYSGVTANRPNIALLSDDRKLPPLRVAIHRDCSIGKLVWMIQEHVHKNKSAGGG